MVMGAEVDNGGLQGEENGSIGWWQWQFMVVGCKVKKLQNFFVPNVLKSPKNNMSFLFFSTLGGWLFNV